MNNKPCCVSYHEGIPPKFRYIKANDACSCSCHSEPPTLEELHDKHHQETYELGKKHGIIEFKQTLKQRVGATELRMNVDEYIKMVDVWDKKYDSAFDDGYRTAKSDIERIIDSLT